MCVSLVSCSSASSEVKVIDIPLTEEEYAFGVDKDQPELLEQANAFIAKIKEDGTFDEICNKYFGDGEPTAVTSATLDESKDQLVVATNAGFEPFEYTKGDSYYGIDMEIAALLAKELGKELVISNMDFDAVCLSVGQHKCDIAMAGLTVKEDRMEYVNFTDTYYNAAQETHRYGRQYRVSTPARAQAGRRSGSRNLRTPQRRPEFRTALPVSSTSKATKAGASAATASPAQATKTALSRYRTS